MSDNATNNSAQQSIDNIDKRLRHSLQPRESPKVPLSSLRPSQSQRANGAKKKRAVIIPPMSDLKEEVEEHKDIEVGVKIEKEKEMRASKKNEISMKAALAYDNAAFESHPDRFSRGGSSRASSVHSLEIVREQYCCCAKRTPCERKLILSVLVLLIVIIVLIVVIVIMVTKTDVSEGLKKAMTTLGLQEK